MSILHRPTRPAVEDPGLPDERFADPEWEDVLSLLRTEPGPEPESPTAGLCCRWEADPDHPGRMHSVWSPRPPGR